VRIERLAARALMAAGLALAAGAAAACGHCVEDRIASVYDHAVIESAKATHLEIAFLAVEGPQPHGDAMRRAVLAALEKGGGVKRTARISLETSACSIAYDPAKVSLRQLVEGSNRALAARGIRLVELR